MKKRTKPIATNEIKLIVYDFDGVMTDNRVIVDENGKESVIVHRGDGYGVRMIRDKLKIHQIILSTEENSVVKRRAEKLNIQVIHGVEVKEKVLRAYCDENNFKLSQVLFIGNDLNDLEAMQLCGKTACPSDAEPEIRLYVDYVFQAGGGFGVVRELYRMLSEKSGDNDEC